MNIRFFLLLLGVLCILLVGLFSWNAYGYYQIVHADDPIDPTLYIESGSGKIIRGDLAIRLSKTESYILKNEDIIETEKDSIAIVRWPDSSITRLWSDTRIIIEKMNVNSDYSTIQISYAIKRGKTWNNVIRLLVGDSYFETRLPKDNIVAWVRGTTFEINLDNKYIQAVTHSTQLSDKSGRSIQLFPGELTSSENILVRKGREWVDTTWNDWNTVSDITYEKIRTLKIESQLETLREKSHSFFSFNGLSEKLLSYVPGFEAISITQYLEAGMSGSLQYVNEDALLEYYQKISGMTGSGYRDTLRTVILTKINNNPASKDLQDLLERASIWESIDTGKILPWAEKFLIERGINISEFSEKFTSGMENDTKKLLETLSGSLNGILKN